MPGDAPLPGDIYLVHPDRVLHGDAHAGPRRYGIVELPRGGPPALVGAIGRTTQRPPDRTLRADLAIASPVNLTCGLNKPGWWVERHLAQLDLAAFGRPTCEFLGSLPPDEALALAEFWDSVKYGG